ncbi:hypothetical protein ABG768_010006 [Culter alburnus]|uniref:Uncharacterized protein n=1 Tax=Culter alburnus TaxID=194366 RepID=A0AAW1ZHS4_CULAL
MDDALKNQEHHPQTELQGWAKKSGSTLVVMLVPSGTPGTGRTNARREKRSDVTRPQPFWDAHEAGVDGADLGWVSYVCEADGSNSCGIERLASGARLPARRGHSRLPRLRAARCHHRPP